MEITEEMGKQVYTYYQNVKALTVSGVVVIIPDVVANNQTHYDAKRYWNEGTNQSFPVRVRGTGVIRRGMVLDGSLYDLWNQGPNKTPRVRSL